MQRILLPEILAIVAFLFVATISPVFAQRTNRLHWTEARTVEQALALEDEAGRDKALSFVAQSLSQRDEPDFTESLRVAGMISDSDASIREFCYSVICLRQAREGRFEESETTFRLMTAPHDVRLETLLTLALIYDRHGDRDTTVKRVDEALAYGREFLADFNIHTTFCRHYHSALVQLQDRELARRMVRDLLDMDEELEKKSSAASFPENLRTGAQRFSNAPVLAMALAHIGDREEAARHFQRYKEMLEAEETRTGFLSDTDRSRLIGNLFDAGFEDEAKKELDELLGELRSGKKKLPQNTDAVQLQKWTAISLVMHCRYAEAFAVARKLPDKKARFEVYDRIENHVGYIIGRKNERVGHDPPQRPFASPRDVLRVAELLADEPDGTSLEPQRRKIRAHAKTLDSSQSTPEP